MIVVPIPTSIDLHDKATATGMIWEDVLDLFRQQPGYRRLYWGRQVENPENVQLHVGNTSFSFLVIILAKRWDQVRGLLSQHHDFLSSPIYSTFSSLLNSLNNPRSLQPIPTIRHALISTFSPSCQSLGLGSPVTGTAIYLSCTGDWETAWATWVSIVQSVPGFLGIAGGPVLEAVKSRHGEQHERCFVALVGWESVAVHEEYHHTQHFFERRRILLDPAEGGFVNYGHIAFGGSSESRVEEKVKEKARL